MAGPTWGQAGVEMKRAMGQRLKPGGRQTLGLLGLLLVFEFCSARIVSSQAPSSLLGAWGLPTLSGLTALPGRELESSMTLSFPPPPPHTHTLAGQRCPVSAQGSPLGPLFTISVWPLSHTLYPKRGRPRPLGLFPRSNSTLYGLELDSVQGTEGP